MQKIMVTDRELVDLDGLTGNDVIALIMDFESKYSGVSLEYVYDAASYENAFDVYIRYDRLENDHEFKIRCERVKEDCARAMKNKKKRERAKQVKQVAQEKIKEEQRRTDWETYQKLKQQFDPE